MRSKLTAPVALALLLPVLTGCKTTPKQRLQGRWVGERVENFQTGQANRAQGWAAGTSFEFRGSQVTVVIPAESPRQGTYEIRKATEQEVVVSFLRPHGARDEVTFLVEGEDQLRWVLGDGRSILLRKVDD
jgi:hypothetical protein